MNGPSPSAAGLLVVAALALAVGVVHGLARGRSRIPTWLAHLPATIAALLSLPTALLVAASGETLTVTLPAVGQLFHPRVLLEPLGALFLIAFSGISVAVLLAGGGGSGGSMSGLGSAGLHLVSLGVGTTFAAGDVYLLLASLELVVLGSWLWLWGERRDAGDRRAAMDALIAGHLSTFLVALGLLLAGSTADSRVGNLATSSSMQSTLRQHVAFGFLLTGFGARAGMLPFHAWLPRALVAATGSGAPILAAGSFAVAAYGLAHASVGWLLPRSAHAVALLGIGVLVSLHGALMANHEDRIRTLLARLASAGFGLVLLGLGVTCGFAAASVTGAASFALAGALFQGLLLVVSSGGILAAAVAFSDGGNERRARWSGVALVSGAAALATLPPAAGFVAAWMTFRGLLVAFYLPAGPLRIAAPLAACALAVAVALGIGAALKLTAMALRPAGPPAKPARVRASPGLLASVALALPPLALITLGLFAGPAVSEVERAGNRLLAGHAGPLAISGERHGGQRPELIPLLSSGLIFHSFSSVSMPAMVLALASAGLAPTLLLFFLRRRVRRAPPWRGGTLANPDLDASPTTFSSPLFDLLHPLLGASEHAELVEGSSALHARVIRFTRAEQGVRKGWQEHKGRAWAALRRASSVLEERLPSLAMAVRVAALALGMAVLGP